MSIRIISRAEIGLNAPKSRVLMSRSNGTHIHWNGPAVPAAVYAGDFEAVKSYLRSTQAFHMGPQRGWADVGYSFAVDSHGRIYELRGWMVAGAHTPNYNSTSHGILLILGEGQSPTPSMVNAVRSLIGEHDRRYGKGYIRPHSAAKATACPGDEVRGMIARGELDPAKSPAPAPAPAPAPQEIDWAAVRRWVAGVAAHNLKGAPTMATAARKKKAGKGGAKWISSGGPVKALQEGYNVATGSSLKVDGVYGPATEARTEDVQRLFGLTVDGVAGPQTVGVTRYVLELIRDGKA